MSALFRKLTMTPVRKAQFARLAAARYDRHEADLLPAVTDALAEYVDTAQAKVLAALRKMPKPRPAELAAAAPLPDPFAAPTAGSHVTDRSRWWTANKADELTAILARHADTFGPLLDARIMPVYARMVDEVLGTALSDGRIAANLIAWRGQWLNQRRQALVGIPDFVTGVFRTAVRGLAERDGTDVDAVAGLTQTMLDKGYPSWKGRAKLIARTETVAANNQGARASWSALAHATGEPATKTWLATVDGKTRPDHADLDGTTVGIDESFDVGGSSMNGPGDDAGGPEQVCNCRCTMTYDFPDDSSDYPGADSSTVTATGWTWSTATTPPRSSGSVDYSPVTTQPGLTWTVPVDPTVQTDPEVTAAAVAEDTTMTAPTIEAPPADVAPPDPELPAEAPADPALEPEGILWEGPIAVLDAASSDGRIIAAAGGAIRPLPLPLSWQRESGPEHDDSTRVGRILAAEIRTDPTLGTILWGTGDYLDPMLNYDAEQAMAQVEAGLGMISVDLALRAIGFADENGTLIDPAFVDPSDEVYEVALEWELGGATLVDFQAFAGARIHNLPTNPDEMEVEPVTGPMLGTETFAAAGAPYEPQPYAPADDETVTCQACAKLNATDAVHCDQCGVTLSAPGGDPYTPAAAEVIACPQDGAMNDTDASFCDQCGYQLAGSTDVAAPGTASADAAGGMADLMAGAAVRPYNAAFFARRNLPGPTPLTVNPDTGEVYGHAATFGECHIGKLAESGRCVTAPHSLTDYADFHLAPIPTDDGTELYVGKITLDTGHASTTPPRFAAARAGYAPAVAHYDNTGTAVAVVRAYDDEHGIQVTGQLVHDLPAARVEELMRSPLSGDWRLRNIPGKGENLEMCAALAVNVPGFPVRPRVGVVNGKQVSLVAAGVVTPDPGRALDAIGLPSGVSIARGDFEALVAAATVALSRGHGRTHSANPDEAAVLSLARLRARARMSA